MGLPEVSLGVIPGYGGTAFATIGRKGRAMELIMTAGMIVQTSQNYGLSKPCLFLKQIIKFTKSMRIKILQFSIHQYKSNRCYK
jgi:hypothetical protein